MKIFTLCDNRKKGNFKAGWGFSCFFSPYKIIFDTGPDKEILEHNSKIFGIKKEEINYCFISHLHADHTGGLNWLSKKTIIFFPEGYDNSIKGISTFVFDYPIKEQSLIFEREKVMVVGCSHPGIVKMAEAVYKKYGKIKLIIGGFHLLGLEKVEVKKIAEKLKEFTEKIAPSHCTGEEAIKTFKSVFKDKFIENYSGKIIEIK